MKYILTFIAVAVLSACGTPISGTVISPAPTTASVEPFSPTPPVVDKTQLYADHIAEFGGINDAVQAAIADTDLMTLGEECSNLTAWAQDGLSLPPLTTRVDVHWDKAMKLFSRAGETCVEGVLTEDYALFAKSGSLLNRASEEIELAANELG